MRKLFLILSLTILLFSCEKKEGRTPDHLLTKQTMIRVMADMEVAAAKVKNLHLSADSTRKLYSLYELSIFENYNISPEQYQESFSYYLDNYNEMTIINNALLDTLSNRQNNLAR